MRGALTWHADDRGYRRWRPGAQKVQIAALTDGVRQLDSDSSDCRQTILAEISHTATIRPPAIR